MGAGSRRSTNAGCARELTNHNILPPEETRTSTCPLPKTEHSTSWESLQNLEVSFLPRPEYRSAVGGSSSRSPRKRVTCYGGDTGLGGINTFCKARRDESGLQLSPSEGHPGLMHCPGVHCLLRSLPPIQLRTRAGRKSFRVGLLKQCSLSKWDAQPKPSSHDSLFWLIYL